MVTAQSPKSGKNMRKILKDLGRWMLIVTIAVLLGVFREPGIEKQVFLDRIYIYTPMQVKIRI